MLNNVNTKVGKYWNYSGDKIKEDTLPEIKNVYEYQTQLLKKIEQEKWSIEDYNKFSSVIKQMLLSDFSRCFNIHQAVLEISLENALIEVINLLNKGIILPNPKINNPYAMIAEMSVEIQRRVLQFSSCVISQNNVNVTNHVEDKVQQYQQILMELQNCDSDYYQFIVTSFNDWVHQTFRSDSLKDAILAMQDDIIDSNIKGVKHKIKIESASLAKSKDEIGKYKKIQAQKCKH